MAVKLPWKVFAGFSLALLAVVSIFSSAVLGRVEWIRQHILPVAVVAAASGLMLALVGRCVARQRNEGSLRAQVDAAAGEAQNPLSFLGRLDYWGYLLLVSAPLLYALTKAPSLPGREVKAVVAVQAPPAATNVIFPELRLQGYIANGAHSSAVINGVTLNIGDRLDGVTLTSVGAGSVTVKMGDEKKVLRLN